MEHSEAYRYGTHRICPPSETLKRIRPLMPKARITRLADVTGLDVIGIPVYQAVRPSALSLSVSQGKGLTRDAAMVSALMESLELWHAETLDLPVVRASVKEMSRTLPYDVAALPCRASNFLHGGIILDWVKATVVRTGESTLVPRSLVALDKLSFGFNPPLFRATSNGLASGNSSDEALLHGLCEVIERDTICSWERSDCSGTRIDKASVHSPSVLSVLKQLERGGIQSVIFNPPSRCGVPVFAAKIYSRDYPLVCVGFGCHPDRDIALCRALTEAVQSRLTTIAGARDDMLKPIELRHVDPAVIEREFQGGSIDYDLVPNRQRSIRADLEEVVPAVEAQTKNPVLSVELSKDDLHLPVHVVVAPAMRMWEH